MQSTMHVYEVRPRKDKRGVDLISDVLPFGRLWYDGPNAAANAIDYATHSSRSHHAVIRVYDEAGQRDRDARARRRRTNERPIDFEVDKLAAFWQKIIQQT